MGERAPTKDGVMQTDDPAIGYKNAPPKPSPLP